MPDSLYERDTLAWSEQQAGLLRRLAAGERVNDAVDWPHVIEEVEDVGQSQLRACRSLLQQAVLHLLKLYAWPDSQAAAHWFDEAGVFLDDAEGAFTPSMRQRIALDDLYSKALRRFRSLRDVPGMACSVPETCPFTLDMLLGGDVAALVAKLDNASPPAAADLERVP